MAGEFMLINPRPKRRKRTKATNRRRRRRVRAAHTNPVHRRRRRRNTRARVHHRRRVHRNPRGLNLGGVDFGSAAITAGGVVGSDIAAGYIAKMLPSAWQTPITRLGVKAVIGIGAPLALKKFIGSRVANLLAAGAAIGVLLDAYHLWVAPAIGLSDYEIGMTGYEPNPGLSGMDMSNQSQLGIGENIYADSVY
jgi:hypothetical protein